MADGRTFSVDMVSSSPAFGSGYVAASVPFSWQSAEHHLMLWEEECIVRTTAQFSIDDPLSLTFTSQYHDPSIKLQPPDRRAFYQDCCCSQKIGFGIFSSLHGGDPKICGGTCDSGHTMGWFAMDRWKSSPEVMVEMIRYPDDRGSGRDFKLGGSILWRQCEACGQAYRTLQRLLGL
jgi:hypothetical protein